MWGADWAHTAAPSDAPETDKQEGQAKLRVKVGAAGVAVFGWRASARAKWPPPASPRVPESREKPTLA